MDEHLDVLGKIMNAKFTATKINDVWTYMSQKEDYRCSYCIEEQDLFRDYIPSLKYVFRSENTTEYYAGYEIIVHGDDDLCLYYDVSNEEDEVSINLKSLQMKNEYYFSKIRNYPGLTVKHYDRFQEIANQIKTVIEERSIMRLEILLEQKKLNIELLQKGD